MHHSRIAALLVVAIALTSWGCGARNVGVAAGSDSVAGSLTPAEIQYGIAPTRNDQVTYQPDVIIPEGMQIGYFPEEDKKRFTVTETGIVVISKRTVL